MNLTPAQLVTLGNHIRANTDASVIQWVTDNNFNAIRDWYNAQASPDFWIFRWEVDTDEVRRSLDADECMTANKFPDIARWNFDNLMRNGTYNPTEQNNREFLALIFSAAQMPLSRNAVLQDATELATEAEKVFAIPATGPAGGDGSSQSNSAEAVTKGLLNTDDVADAMAATAP
jgi:hypothetical protein